MYCLILYNFRGGIILSGYEMLLIYSILTTLEILQTDVTTQSILSLLGMNTIKSYIALQRLTIF